MIDAMNGIASPYAHAIFKNLLGTPVENLYNCESLPEFGGHHPDPNLVYAEELVKVMDVFRKQQDSSNIPEFGAACDGDADRNMILGKIIFIYVSFLSFIKYLLIYKKYYYYYI